MNEQLAQIVVTISIITFIISLFLGDLKKEKWVPSDKLMPPPLMFICFLSILIIIITVILTNS